MSKEWSTKNKDIHLARTIMEEFAIKQDSDALGLFELVVDTDEKKMNFRISNWVFVLAQKFNNLYGAHQGDFVTRQVISHCMVQGQTVH